LAGRAGDRLHGGLGGLGRVGAGERSGGHEVGLSFEYRGSKQGLEASDTATNVAVMTAI